MPDALEARVLKIIYTTLVWCSPDTPGGHTLALDDTLDNLLADELDRFNIVTDCDQEFGIAIPDADFAAVVTVGDLVALVRKLTLQGEAAA